MVGRLPQRYLAEECLQEIAFSKCNLQLPCIGTLKRMMPSWKTGEGPCQVKCQLAADLCTALGIPRDFTRPFDETVTPAGLQLNEAMGRIMGLCGGPITLTEMRDTSRCEVVVISRLEYFLEKKFKQKLKRVETTCLLISDGGDVVSSGGEVFVVVGCGACNCVNSAYVRVLFDSK
jgi:hypothetical protein